MPRKVEILLKKRNVRAIATLLEDVAPHTCDVISNALPIDGDVYHANRANCEIYPLSRPFETAPGLEHGPQGFTPLNIFATISGNLPEFAEACENIWRAGGLDERLIFRPLT